MLREDNADLRLTPVGRELGLVDDRRWSQFNQKREAIVHEQARLRSIVIHPGRLTPADTQRLGQKLQRECTAADLLRRPELDYRSIAQLSMVGAADNGGAVNEERREQVELQLEAQAKYAGYIELQEREIAKHAKQEALRLPDDIDYAAVYGLSHEARQRLETARPVTLGQASRLEGMTPSAVSLLLVHLKKRQIIKSA